MSLTLYVFNVRIGFWNKIYDLILKYNLGLYELLKDSLFFMHFV